MTYSYDEFNRLTSVKSPVNELTSYEYLLSGQLAKIVDPENNQTLFEYDLLGRLTKKIDPLGHSTQLAYDSSDNVTQEIDPMGHVKTFEYDHLDRLVKKILPDDVYEMTYDERNNIKSVKNSRSEVAFDYLHLDSSDVVVKEVTKGLGELSDLPPAVLNYSYDESGNRTGMSTSEGNFSYSYDKLNRLTKIINHKDETFDFSYDQGSRLTAQRSPASQTEYSYDDVNFLTAIAHKKRSNQNILSQLNYERDAIGNITKKTSLRGDHVYSYDGNNQLINATHPETVTSVFAYDALGNRVTDEKGNYSYGSKKQRLESDWRFNYLYDNNGNMVSKVQRSDSRKITNYEYSSENQLLAIKEYDGPTLFKESFYGYDALGRRVLKEHVDHSDDNKSFTKKFIYDGQSILFEVNGDNDLLATYTHSLNRIDDVLAMDRNNTSYFYLKDHLGTINEILNSSGNVIQRYVYSAFGEVLKTEDGNGQALASPAVENFFTFTGRESDFESGLNYYRARYYDPYTGRFISEDPKGFKGKDTNLYRYARNNPIKYIDYTGNSAQLADMGGGMAEYNLRMQFASCLSTSAGALGYAGSLCTAGCAATGAGMPACVGAVEALTGALISAGAAACVVNYVMRFNQSQQSYAPGTTINDTLNVIRNDLIESGIGLTDTGIDIIRGALGKK